MFKFIKIDPNQLLAMLSCELGPKITRYRFIGGQASGTPDDHIINCIPHGFYDMIISCPNSHNKLELCSVLLKITRLALIKRYLNIFVTPIRMKS